MTYEVLFYNGWEPVPTYYMIGAIEGDSPVNALAANIARITRRVRILLRLREAEVPSRAIQQALYVLRENGLVSLRDVERLRAGATKS